MDYNSEEYQAYLAAKREERKKKLIEGDGYEKAHALKDAERTNEAIVELTAGVEPIQAVDAEPPVENPIKPVFKIRDPGATGA